MKRFYFVGIDVGKANLDVAVKVTETDCRPTPAKRAHEAWVSPNTDAGVAQLVERLRGLGPQRIALEATGGYEQRVFRALREAGLPAVIIKPLSVREFARAMGRQAKTDKIDALVLAHFAEVRHPEVLPLPTANQERIAALRGLRADLLATRVAYTNRTENCRAEAKAHIEALGPARPQLGLDAFTVLRLTVLADKRHVLACVLFASEHPGSRPDPRARALARPSTQGG